MRRRRRFNVGRVLDITNSPAQRGHFAVHVDGSDDIQLSKRVHHRRLIGLVQKVERQHVQTLQPQRLIVGAQVGKQTWKAVNYILA